MRLHWPGLQRLRVKRQRVQVQAVSRRTARIRGVPLPHTLQIAAVSRPPTHTYIPTSPECSWRRGAASHGLTSDMGSVTCISKTSSTPSRRIETETSLGSVWSTWRMTTEQISS
jgi:hypothetical protein